MVMRRRRGRAYWRRQHEAWIKSGLSQYRFCQKRGHTLSTFSRWHGMLKGEEPKPPKDFRKQGKRAFVALAPSVPFLFGGQGWVFEVELRQGHRIRIGKDFDEAAFGKVIRVLGEAC